MVTKFDKFDIIHDEGRDSISLWRDKRLKKMAARKSYLLFYLHTFKLETLQSFLQNFNFMVLFQMLIAGVAVYLFQKFNIAFDLHVTLFVSPIVFPLAFSIDADFQRREKVLEDLAQFKSSGMVWYFCMRDWKQAAQLDNDWITAVQDKLRSVLFHLREYLLTYKPDRRKIILRAMYEDFSDMNQLIEKLRASKLPSNSAIVSRAIHLLNMMCLSFERLRVVREYRSPRSIRSFNKVLIMILPIILAPYYVFLGEKNGNQWEPYYISVLVAFVFSALQGVQDKLDDPFDGMSEDDINLDSFDEWNSSLEHTMKRTFAIGRFKVSVEEKITKQVRKSAFTEKDKNMSNIINKNNKQKNNRYFSSLGLGVNSMLSRDSSIDENNNSYNNIRAKKQNRRITIQTDRMRPIINNERVVGRYDKIFEPKFPKSLSFNEECLTIPENEYENHENRFGGFNQTLSKQCNGNLQRYNKKRSLSHSISISEQASTTKNSPRNSSLASDSVELIPFVNNATAIDMDEEDVDTIDTTNNDFIQNNTSSFSYNNKLYNMNNSSLNSSNHSSFESGEKPRQRASMIRMQSIRNSNGSLGKLNFIDEAEEDDEEEIGEGADRGGGGGQEVNVDDDQNNSMDDEEVLRSVLCEWNILDATLRREIFASKDRTLTHIQE